MHGPRLSSHGRQPVIAGQLRRPKRMKSRFTAASARNTRTLLNGTGYIRQHSAHLKIYSNHGKELTLHGILLPFY